MLVFDTLQFLTELRTGRLELSGLGPVDECIGHVLEFDNHNIYIHDS